MYSEFAKLNTDNQRIAKNIISDIQTGKLQVSEEFSLVEMITQYAKEEQDNRTKEFCVNLGIDVDKFNEISEGINKDNPDEGGKLSDLIKLANPAKAKSYFEKRDKAQYQGWKVNTLIRESITKFVTEK